jgi:hypothetical protein
LIFKRLDPHPSGKVVVRPNFVDAIRTHSTARLKSDYSEEVLPADVAFIVHARNFDVSEFIFHLGSQKNYHFSS